MQAYPLKEQVRGFVDSSGNGRNEGMEGALIKKLISLGIVIWYRNSEESI